MNSTLKSLLFWMALVVVGVLIWNVSTKFQQNDHSGQLQRVHGAGRSREASQQVVITGQEITGTTKDKRDVPHLRARRSTKGSPTS